MSQENLEIVRRSYQAFNENGCFESEAHREHEGAPAAGYAAVCAALR
jgi:hypothetical protein